MSPTAPLDRYIRLVLQDRRAKIFCGSSLPKPTLIRGKVAHILTYRGCFNPPHQGHLDVLCHGISRGGDDLNVIAAIVYFLDDDSVRGKVTKTSDSIEPIVFTQKERMNLFNSGASHSSWHYCHPLDSSGAFAPFREMLREEVARDGFEIQFVTLTGPDHLGTVKDEEVFRDKTIVAGNGHPKRTRFRAETKTGLRRLHNYSDWYMLPLEDVFGSESKPEWLERKLEMMSHGDAVTLPKDATERELAVKLWLQMEIWHLGPVRACQNLSRPAEQWIRFVPTQSSTCRERPGI